MKAVIEFCRVREGDGARAVLGRVTCDVIDAGAAIGMARSLFNTLDMPQAPDIVSVFDDQGREFYSAMTGAGLERRQINNERM
jgi:hypothetical protein